MIKCSNCGTINPDTIKNCQNCMATLPAPTGRNESGFGPQASQPSAPVLPAWLESLRAGDHPAAPPKNFSREDMVDEEKIPSWMQANRPPQSERDSNQYPSLRSSAFPSPNTDDSAARNISANSLIDPNALPSWMQPEKPQGPQQSISGASLVQPEFMPAWMKTMQPSTQQPTPLQQPTAPQPPVQGFAAQQLIDQQSLPQWMREGGQSAMPPLQPSPAQPVQPQSPPQSPYGPTGQQSFSASSLLDVNSMPSWLRDGQEQRSPLAPPSQQASWQQPQQPPAAQPWQNAQQQPLQQNYPPASNANASSQGQGGTLSMGSLIDVNALPEWLRSADSQQGALGGPQNNGYNGFNNAPNTYDISPRIDNMRVPSRPRGEVGANEGSEVAANVFSSMLGVASNAPQYPGQQQGYPAPTTPAGQPMGNPAQYNNVPQPMPGMPGISEAQRYAQGQPGTQNYGQSYPNNPQPMPGGYPNLAGSTMLTQNQGQSSQNMGQGFGQDNTQKPAKKGGIFEAIRSFFFR